MNKLLLPAAALLLTSSLLGACASDATANVQAMAQATAASKAQVEAQSPGQYRPEPKLDNTAAWTDLFNGKDLAGWRTINGTKGHQAKFEAKDGQLVATNDLKCGLNTFLRTEQGYSDFVFTCDFLWDVECNSGVQIRSHQRPWGVNAWDGRLWGYQVEMDPSPRAWTAGLQEEGGSPARGWLVPLKGDKMAAARNAVKLKGWNRLTIRAIGPRVETWLNGVPCTDYTEQKVSPDTGAGFIALQVHYGHPGQLRWRNLKILPLGPVAPVAFPAPPSQEKK